MIGDTHTQTIEGILESRKEGVLTGLVTRSAKNIYRPISTSIVSDINGLASEQTMFISLLTRSRRGRSSTPFQE